MVNVKNNDSIGKTLLVVLLLCLICSSVVASSSVFLKTRQQEQRALDKQRNILRVAGLLKPNMKNNAIVSIYTERIIPQLLDLKTGVLLKQDPISFNPSLALKDPAQSLSLELRQDPAGIKRRSNIVEIYLVTDASKQVQEVVLPIYGNGLWSMMYAFVALDTDARTVKGLAYYEQGETPGLGGEVANPNWHQQFFGKKVLDDNGMPALKVVKGAARPGDAYAVDGLCGATLTSNGVQHSFDFWMGELGFGPFLKKVRKEGLNNG